MAPLPLSLFASGEPELAPTPTFTRGALDDDCWVDFASNWYLGGDTMFDRLLFQLPWKQDRRLMFDRWVDEPRLTTGLKLQTAPLAIREMAAALSRRYAKRFTTCWCNYYRDGNDSVAWHRDQVGRRQPFPLVAIVSLGGPRTFALRPKTPKHGETAHRFVMHSGDLLVMGGATQHRWEHGIAKCARAAPRMSVTFRHG